MEGERSEDSNISWEDDPVSEIIPRAMNQLFSRLQKQVCSFSTCNASLFLLVLLYFFIPYNVFIYFICIILYKVASVEKKIVYIIMSSAFSRLLWQKA